MREANRVVMIEARGQLVDLRLRVQKFAANLDDGMRLVNRLVAAVLELLSSGSATVRLCEQHSSHLCNFRLSNIRNLDQK